MTPSDKADALLKVGSEELEKVERLVSKLKVAYEEARRARNEAYELKRELTRLQERNRLLDDRRRQLEEVVASSFARSVKMLSGSQKQLGASQDAAQVVKAVEDQFRALRLLRDNNVLVESVERGVRLLLDERDRVTEVPTEPFHDDAITPVRIYEATAETIPPDPPLEVAGTYRLLPDGVEPRR